jgi:hypothetical protein
LTAHAPITHNQPALSTRKAAIFGDIAEVPMSLEEDLKAKTLSLINQQMANWVVSIQRQIADHQGTLVRALDDLSESVARYDEKINEPDIGRTMAEVVASQPAAGPVGPGLDKLRASLGEIEKGTSLSEVLTYLVNEVALYVDRVAMFIIKGSSAIGWYSKGVEPADAVKQINVPIQADTVFRIALNSRHALRGHVSHSPGTAQHVARLGGSPQGVLAVPLILRDKVAAVLYCDTKQDEIPAAEAGLIEVLVLFAGKTIDLLSFLPKATATTRTSVGTTPERVAAIRAGGDDIRERAGVPSASAPPPPPPAARDEGSSTVMFKAGSIPAGGAPQARPAAPPPAPARPAAPPPVAAEDQKAHEDAKRFARLVVSEIKLYNEAKVNEGRRHKDIYERLKEDIERGRQMYSERVAPQIRDSTTYFYDELVRILAGGDAAALGPM